VEGDGKDSTVKGGEVLLPLASIPSDKPPYRSQNDSNVRAT